MSQVKDKETAFKILPLLQSVATTQMEVWSAIDKIVAVVEENTAAQFSVHDEIADILHQIQINPSRITVDMALRVVQGPTPQEKAAMEALQATATIGAPL